MSLTFYLSLVESVIDAHYELDIVRELARAIYSSDLVLDLVLKTLVELGNIGIVILIQLRDDLSESRSVRNG